MEKPEQWQFGTGLTMALAGVGMSVAVESDESKLVGALLGLLGLLLIVSSLRPTLATSLPLRWLRSRFVRTSRNFAVSDRLRVYAEEMMRLVEQSRGTYEYADKHLKPWKHEVIEFLDANVQEEVVWEFAKLATRGDGDHLQSSYKAHLEFLEDLRTKVERGRYVKWEESPSGNVLPRVHSFVFQSKLRRDD